MTQTVLLDEDQLRNSINFLLPAVPIVVDHVERAMEISKKYLSNVKRTYNVEDNMYLHSLRVALKVAERCSVVSEKGFFKWQPIVVALLHDVLEDADCSELRQDLLVFRSTDSYVMNGIHSLTNSEDGIKEFGRSKYMNLKFSELINGDRDIFYIKLADRVDNLKCMKLIENTDLYKNNPELGKMFKTNYFLESMVVNQQFKISGATDKMHESVLPLYREFSILLNTGEKF
jgi:(p)ppGpp synthase/HD superfamily hydrolase